MSRPSWPVLLTLVSVLAATPAALAEPGGTGGESARDRAMGSLEGTVRDTEGVPLPGATVTTRRQPVGSWTTLADGEGHYRLLHLRPGVHVVEARLEGWYLPARVSGVRVEAGRAQSVDLTLAYAPTPGCPDVVVWPPPFDPRQSETVYVIRDERLTRLPH